MSRAKYFHSTLSGLVDSDSDDARFTESMPTPDSNAENRPIAKKGRGRPPISTGKVTKAKAPARRTSGRVTAGSKSKRAALTDKTNKQNAASDTEEVDEFDEQATEVMDTMISGDELASVDEIAVKQRRNLPAKKGRPAMKVIKSGKNATSKSIQETPETRRPAAKKQSKRVVPEEIQETQADTTGIIDEADEVVEEPTPKPISRYAGKARAESQSRQPSVQRKRAGSASDTERSDPALRRKLGEMTTKFESVNLKYINLREIGIKEAEHNFERFKKQSEEKDAAAKKVIASLKTDLAGQTGLEKQTQDLRIECDGKTSQISKLQADVARLEASLANFEAMSKTLSAKLAMNRNAAVSVESASSKTPSAIRVVGSAEAAQQVQAGQLKEDIYADLTGLLIRSVKREAEEDVFDCIQTGRNGTLHFKLSAANEKSAESFEEAQCTYVPLLDPSRDKALMELLPDYLIDEIMFPRQQAAKFYTRISDALTKKLEQ